jgi:amino acid transporter
VNVVHLHLLLNHLPVVGSLFAVLLFAGSLYKRAVSPRFALWFAVGLGAIALGVYLTGEPAADSVEKLVGVTERSIESHEEAAELTTIVAGILGALSLIALARFRRREVPRWIGAAGFVGAVLLSAAMGWTANLGGQIRHREIRGGMTPLSGSQVEHEAEQ